VLRRSGFVSVGRVEARKRIIVKEKKIHGGKTAVSRVYLFEGLGSGAVTTVVTPREA